MIENMTRNRGYSTYLQLEIRGYSTCLESGPPTLSFLGSRFCEYPLLCSNVAGSEILEALGNEQKL